ncbi:MAG TPA: transglutaminaseTgpA domain-containing protein [Candidatus Limnocylindrales bacterium]|nr:transglutaminaseTgpA domain-containing protein [Candidatus Limnocylindrales bacterium]
MSAITTSRHKDTRGLDVRAEEREELADMPLTPREGWLSVISLAAMMMVVGIAIDDARWAGLASNSSTSQTGFLPICGVFSVLVGVALAKGKVGRYSGHLIGSTIGALFVLNAAAASISNAPSIEGRLRALNESVTLFVDQVIVEGARSYETSIFLILLGALVWGAGQFSAYAVFRRHKPLPAILLTGFMLLLNVSVTVKDEYVHLIAFMAAALVLLVRLNLLDQTREWRARGMGDVAEISGAFLRNGASFVAIAIIAATTLAANASSAPLARAWQNLDDDLLEVGYSLNRWLGGISGAARGPNVLFTPNQTIRGVWESSSAPVFTAVTSDGEGYRWRGATYDAFDGHTWSQSDRESIIVGAGDDVLGQTPDAIDPEGDARYPVEVTINPIDYGGDVIVAPADPVELAQDVEVQTHGLSGPFAAVKLTAGIQTDVPFTVLSLVREVRGENALTGNELAVAGTQYPDWVSRYLQIGEESSGDIVAQAAQDIVASLPASKRDPYHIADAVENYLWRTGGFEYNTDVRGLCPADQPLADCLLTVKQGYCEYFATAMTMMLRELGIPARYVVGYLPGREQQDGSYLVDRSAAHAWVEVYFPGHGWVEFDPTPGNGENGQEPTNFAAGPDRGPAPTRRPLGGGPNELECADPTDIQCQQPGGPPVFPVDPPVTPTPPRNDILPLAIGGGAVLGLLLLALMASLRHIPKTEPELAYRGVTRLATRLGHGPRPAQTAYEFASGLGEVMPLARTDLHLIATAKVEATYGRKDQQGTMLRMLGLAYRRVRLGMLRLVLKKRPRIGHRPRSGKAKRE